jgi:type III pantothenate kinase
MLLTIDIGNSQIAFGVFETSALRASWHLATDAKKTSDQYGSFFLSLMSQHDIHPKNLDGTIISSVVPPVTPIIKQVIETYFHHRPLIVTADFPFGLILQYANPHEIGTDRLVNAAAAYARFQSSLIIVDFGTATTFCTVTSDGRYLGGAIAPGLKSSAQALHAHTAKLPNVELIRPKNVVGTDTASSIQSGLIFGYSGLVDELTTRIQKEVGQTSRVIATGGFASILAPVTQSIQEVCPYLTLEGLSLLYQRVKN